MMNRENVRGSLEPNSSVDHADRVQQRLAEVHRLMEQLEDRVLFDAVPDMGLIVEAEVLSNFFDTSVAITNRSRRGRRDCFC